MPRKSSRKTAQLKKKNWTLTSDQIGKGGRGGWQEQTAGSGKWPGYSLDLLELMYSS